MLEIFFYWMLGIFGALLAVATWAEFRYQRDLEEFRVGAWDSWMHRIHANEYEKRGQGSLKRPSSFDYNEVIVPKHMHSHRYLFACLKFRENTVRMSKLK